MSPTIRRGITSPVEALEPKVKAINVTKNMPNPLIPDLDQPKKKAAMASTINS